MIPIYFTNPHHSRALLLHSLMASFPVDLISQNAVLLLNVIFLNCSVEDITKLNLLKQLGVILVEKTISQEDCISVLDKVLKFVTCLKDPKEYVACIGPWAEFTAKHFPLKQINFIINDLLSHMTPNRAFEDHYPEILSVMEGIVANVTDLEGLVTMVSLSLWV